MILSPCNSPQYVRTAAFKLLSFLSPLLALAILLPGCSPSVMPPDSETAHGPQVQAENGIPTISMDSGFHPDPFIYNLRAGGSTEGDTFGFRGYFPASPSAVLEFSPDKYPLTIILRSESDNVMMLRTPSGQTLFNDDFEGLDAGFTLYDPEEGRYEIFAGLLSDPLPVPAELEITEIYAPDRPAPVVTPNLDAEPLAGSTSLSAGFSPDPFTQEITLRGDSSFGNDYNGFFTAEPTFRLNYEAGDMPLTILNESDDADTVILVYTPGGLWEYNDDFENLNAGISLDSPASGEYLIWMGTYGETSSPARLRVSENYVPQAERLPDTTLEPEYETLSLSSGFEPDPVRREAFLMGGMEYANYNGFFSEAPSFILDYEAGDAPLTLIADSDGDSVMLVYGPGGEWQYNDDFDGLNAGLYFRNPESGRYLIWMGSYSDEGVEASLEVSESFTPPSERRPDISAAPMETIDFSPGQNTLIQREIALSTNTELSGIGSGYVSENPHFAVNMADGTAQVRISASASLDTTLLVYTPSGEWLFNDDFDGLDPAIILEDAEAGRYLVWVGSFYGTSGTDDMNNQVRLQIE